MTISIPSFKMIKPTQGTTTTTSSPAIATKSSSSSFTTINLYDEETDDEEDQFFECEEDPLPVQVVPTSVVSELQKELERLRAIVEASNVRLMGLEAAFLNLQEKYIPIASRNKTVEDNL